MAVDMAIRRLFGNFPEKKYIYFISEVAKVCAHVVLYSRRIRHTLRIERETDSPTDRQTDSSCLFCLCCSKLALNAKPATTSIRLLMYWQKAWKNERANERA